MKPISIEIRKMIVAAKERGEKEEEIIKWSGVSRGSIYNIFHLYKTTGSVEPKPYPGKKSIVSEEMLEQIRMKIKEKNDITLEELIKELNLPIKKSRLSALLINMGMSFKKRR